MLASASHPEVLASVSESNPEVSELVLALNPVASVLESASATTSDHLYLSRPVSTGFDTLRSASPRNPLNRVRGRGP